MYLKCQWADEYRNAAVWPADVPFPMPITNIGEKYGEVRAEWDTSPPWGMIQSFKAMVVSRHFDMVPGLVIPIRPSLIDLHLNVFGWRALQRIKESGYQLEGHIKIQGKSYSAFTSSQNFIIGTRRVEVACIHVRLPKDWQHKEE